MMKRFKDFIKPEYVDVYEGDFAVTKKMITNGKINRKLPNIINGEFNCSNLKLTTLEGCPKEVKGDFFCAKNLLTDLKHCPEKIGEAFHCSFNKLTSLEGCPTIINGIFNCSKNELTNLKNGPDDVYGNFYCHENKLTSLEGCPIYIKGRLIYIIKNITTDLVGYPKYDDLYTESKFIKSDFYTQKERYWKDLLQFMMAEKINLDNVKGWPKGFLSPEVIASAKGIVKFNL